MRSKTVRVDPECSEILRHWTTVDVVYQSQLSTTEQSSGKRRKPQTMTSIDLLGDDGREALNACVRVCIFGSVSQPSNLAREIGYTPRYPALASEGLDAATLKSLKERIFNDEISGMKRETGYFEIITERGLEAFDREGKLVREYSTTLASYGNLLPTKRHERKDISAMVYRLCDRGKDTQEKKQESKRQEAGSECATACGYFSIGIGSGFILHNHFIVTSRHVLKSYNEEESRQICISNAVIGKLPCKVAYQDEAIDLALLYCPDLNIEQSGIHPLRLSNQSLLPGMPMFSFGYPMGHTGDTALFVTGHVSERTSSLMSLNCPLNSGNLGGPVISRINDGQIKVVGIVTQKRFKEVLTLEEQNAIEKIQKSPQTSLVNPQPQLTLKLYGILKTHSLLDVSYALPGCIVVDFVRNSTSKHEGDHKEELAEIIEWSEEL